MTAIALKAALNVQSPTATTAGVTTAPKGGGNKRPHMPMHQSILPVNGDMVTPTQYIILAEVCTTQGGETVIAA